MKRSMFAVFAALTLLFAAPVVAQHEENVDESQLQPYESRTNPNADSTTQDSGLTITGTVEEWNDEQLVLRTATGIQHIQIVPSTDRPVDFTVGENVSVDYTRTTQGVMIATEIRPEGALGDADTMTEPVADETLDADVQAEADVDTNLDTMDEDVTADVDAQAGLESDFDTDVDTDLDTQADLDTDTTMDSTLPATGSELPLLALLGLLSVAAAVGVRSFIR